MCPPDHDGAVASVWIRAIAHDHGGSVITYPFPLSLRIFTYIPLSLRIFLSFQVHGTAAVDEILKVLNMVQAAQKSSPKPAVKYYDDDDVSDIEDIKDNDDSGNEGSDDEGSEDEGSDDESRRIALSQWHGLFTDDVSWWIGGCYSFL